MDLKDVKAISIPEGSVSKITDSNGNIIWGSEDVFPYRRLEYIDIPPDAYINTNEQGNSNIGLKLDININIDEITTVKEGNLFGSIYYNGSTYYRYHITSNSSGTVQAWFGTGNNAYKNTGLISTDSDRHYIEINSHSPKDKKLYVDNVDLGTYTTPSTNNTGVMYVGARRFNNNGTVSANIYTRKMRVYFMETTGNDIATNPNDASKYYPVQRKSDGKVGLMKIWSNGQATRFCPSETSTECLAGPTVDEYFTGKEWPS